MYSADDQIKQAIKKSWDKIAPFWPLKNLVAVNPLQGLEDLPIEEALIEAALLFEQEELPKPMAAINRVTIKWLQAFFDDGQAVIKMPLCDKGLYAAWRKLACFDEQLHAGESEKQQWLAALPSSSEAAVAACLAKLNIPQEEQVLFLTLMLTTLPGWAAYTKCQTNSTTQADYLALRLIITCLLWEQAVELIDWYKKARTSEQKKTNALESIKKAEQAYRVPLLKALTSQTLDDPRVSDVQLVFCIDVRSESFRRALEAQGNYETFGFAGFFGLPMYVEDGVTGESYASCPPLVKPKHTVTESSSPDASTFFRRLYRSLKYNFTTPFALVDVLGLPSAVWMALKTLVPLLATKLKVGVTNIINPRSQTLLSLQDISFAEQCTYAENALKMMGFTKNFAPLVVLCGHGSATQNNAHATFLDCGACRGRHGASNARVLAAILNDTKVREHLSQNNIVISKFTHFIAAGHNTTTDEVAFYPMGTYDAQITEKLSKLQNDLAAVRKIKGLSELPSVDWAHVRPEWGLARNASVIIAPRELSKNVDLAGRSFLHSYDYRQDPDGALLTAILTAPLVVGQWINSQYLFSTLDPVAYGAGSKITMNITGKIGVMQGNASDLMHGLPLQSVYVDDTTAYHEPLRLLTVVYAPRGSIDKIIKAHEVLQKLFGNGWVTLACIDPNDAEQWYFLQRDLTWERGE